MNCLFPPIQWWIAGFIPGSIFGLLGILVFLTTSHISENYTYWHSLWHCLIAFSLIGFLPWPYRWRLALRPIIPMHISLSCGNLFYLSNNNNNNQDLSYILSDLVINVKKKHDFVRTCEIDNLSSLLRNEPGNSVGFVRKYDYFRNRSKFFVFLFLFWTKTKLFWKQIFHYYDLLNFQLDDWLQMYSLLDWICIRWPKLKWILPFGNVLL